MVWAVSLSTTKLISRSLTATLILIGIRSLIGFGKLVGPLVHSVLYLRQRYVTLYLNIFRGEPDISEFDQPFTPIPTSSKHVVRYNGSVLHLVLPKLQPGQGQITRFRVYSQRLVRPIKTRFRYGSVFDLTWPLKITRWLIMQKARCHPCMQAYVELQLLLGARFQDLFHSSIRGSFRLSLTVLVHYRSPENIQPQMMVHLDSSRIPRVPPYSGTPLNLKTLLSTGLLPSMVGISTPFL